MADFTSRHIGAIGEDRVKLLATVGYDSLEALSEATVPSDILLNGPLDLPPAILTVGTADWLLDESILLAGRLAAAGNEVDLAVYPEGPHGVESMPTALGRAASARIFEFLGSKLRAAS